MSYWLYLPEQPVPPGGFPLVVMLHGCDQSATIFAEGTRMNQHAEQAGYAVLYPQQSVSAHPHRCWHWFDRATQQGGGEVPTIAGIIRKVLDRYPIDRTRVSIAGLSAGAAMAHIVALNYPELFAALGMHSGPLFGAGHGGAAALGIMQYGANSRAGGAIAEVLNRNAAFPPMPTILIQGEEDPVVRQVNLAQLEQQAMLLNRLSAACRVTVLDKPGNRNTHPYSVREVYQGKTLMLQVVRIAELKHAWSGGDERLSFNCGAGPDASRMLLAFFARHRRVVGTA
jgi:poly(hydroxyalkanoate) depolymerase family esterase